MENIEKWLKSLRLHKYTNLFKKLTYEQMLELQESFLIGANVTKGARNKMLVSIKKLHLRRERLLSLAQDVQDNNLSPREALTVLKEILLTPIPTGDSLTHLFLETLQQIILRFTRQDNDNATLTATIIDDCLRHDSFTAGQKARVAGYKNFLQTAAAAATSTTTTTSSRQRPAPTTRPTTNRQQQQSITSTVSLLHHHQPYQYQYQHHHQQYQYQHQQYHQNQQQRRSYFQPQFQFKGTLTTATTTATSTRVGLPMPLSAAQKASLSTIASSSCCNSGSSRSSSSLDEEEPPVASIGSNASSTTASLSPTNSNTTQQSRQSQQTFQEYSLLGPGKSFELPCLRARITANNPNISLCRRGLLCWSVEQV